MFQKPTAKALENWLVESRNSAQESKLLPRSPKSMLRSDAHHGAWTCAFVCWMDGEKSLGDCPCRAAECKKSFRRPPPKILFHKSKLPQARKRWSPQAQ